MNKPHHIAASSQRLAAHPHHSAWVAASAGSGKTKVLTDRVLNLLLEGTPPERLLCLTFTKAAAAEMANRLHTRLGEWAVLPESALKDALQDLGEAEVTPQRLEQARRLFSLTLDTPGGLKIQTIHSFCQSLLKRFPLEAGISPFFTVMEEGEQNTLLRNAFYSVLQDPLFSELALRFSESTFENLNAFILQKRDCFVNKPPLLPSKPTEIFHIPEDEVKRCLSLFQQGSPTDRARGEALAAFLTLPKEEQERKRMDYLSLFLTQQGEKRARLLTQSLATACPSLQDFLEKEARRLEAWVEQHKTYEVLKVSHSLHLYSQAFLKAYDNLKINLSFLDYEDLILKTVALLKNPGCHWVLYKLDGGIDHILLDEAQDTSPSQWQVVRAIAEEFYTNAATDPRNRTLFIVGDSKQSIYSFQGVDPRVFSQMQNDLHTFAKTSEKKWENVELNISFRSTPEILSLVNAVFPSYPLHLPFRKDTPGHVEMWPLILKEDTPDPEPWQLPLATPSKESPQKCLARKIARTIQGWLTSRGPLSRPTTPGDILILVRRRTAFVDIMIRALKELAIPVAGIDRLSLLTNLGIQDLLKIGEFLLLPDNDLALATILKGPLFNLSEEDLFSLSYNRGEMSLWERLLAGDKFSAHATLLQELLTRADLVTPFALYSYILGPLKGRQKWQAHLGSDVLDSFDEFLNLCLTFQKDHIASLQQFIHWISLETIELKRDLEQNNQVRIMTVHGSKGLQAPIVFLPDTTQAPGDLPPFAFNEDRLLWLPPADHDIPLTKAMKDSLRQIQTEEYWRLLYVALTRAADALYICGWEGREQDNWYSHIEKAIQKIGRQEQDTWYISSLSLQDSLSLGTPEKPPPLLPPWLFTSPSLEKPPKVLHPSDSKTIPSFSSSAGVFGPQRGILIHKLLEILPSLPPQAGHQAGLEYLRKSSIPLPLAKEILASAQKVLEVYPDIFGPFSQAEVPLMGYLGETLISGQIDRLVVEEDSIFVVDFKTHSHVPHHISEIPKVYLKQMGLYHAVLSRIYPDKTITCALLWTEILRLDLLPSSLMEEEIHSLAPLETLPLTG